MTELPREYAGWWRIVDASTSDKGMLDLIGTAMISITGRGDRLRMFALLADVNWRVTKTGLSFAGRAPGSSIRCPGLGASG